LHDWWHWTRRIAKEQSRLARINKAKTSRKLRKLYRVRQRRFRHAVNAIIKTIVEVSLGISKIVVGNLKGIRNNNHNSKANAIINNFWSLNYIIRKLKAEEWGIKVIGVSEHGTSSTCPRCHSKNTTTRGRLFKCLKCGLEAHRDVVGVLNMGILHNGGMSIGVVAHPLLLRWNGMRWEPKKGGEHGTNENPRSRNRIHRDDGGIPHASAVGGRQIRV